MLVGAYQLDGSARPEWLEHAIADAVGTPGAPVRSTGPLVLARSGGSAGTNCALQGRIHGLDDLREALDVDNGELDAECLFGLAWARFGKAALELLRGSFALVAWNDDARDVVLARDRLGAEPLYYHVGGGRVTFASEVRGVLALLATRPGPDEAALAHWLAMSAPPGGRTLYDGVRRLREGHMLVLSPEGCRERRWHHPRQADVHVGNREAAVEGLRERLEQAVARAAGGPQATGVLLSGGLDSTALAGVARRAAGPATPPAAYSAVFPRHRAVDERALIELTVGQLGLPSSMLSVTGGSPLAGSLEYLRTWELPPSSPNLFFWLPLLRRAAADGVEVMLDGEGGDELFGVARYLLADRIRRGRPLAALRLAQRFPGAGDTPPWPPVLRVWRDYGLRAAARFGRPAEVRPAPSWLSPGLTSAYNESLDPWSWSRADGPRWWAFAGHQLTGTSGAVLARDQVRHRSAMAGIEARHPLHDVELVDFVLGLDPELSFDPHRSRPLLRAAVHGLIPEEVRLRPGKSTFDAVFHQGLLGNDLPAVARLLTGPDSELAAFVRPGAVRSELVHPPAATSQSERQARALYLWRLATAECWLRAQMDADAPARVLADLDPGRHDWSPGAGPFFNLAPLV